MTGLPDSILIALWVGALWVVTLGVVGSCWAAALAAWLFEGTASAALPLIIGGALAGAAEWIFRRDHR